MEQAGNSMKKNLLANPSPINFWKPKKKSYSDEDTDFHTKEILKVGFNYKKSLKRWTDLLVYSNWYFFVYLFIYILNFTPKFIHVSQGLISN